MAKKAVIFPHLDDIAAEERKVVVLSQYPDNGTTDDDWLMRLPVGAEFLSRPSFTTYELDEWEVLRKTKTSIQLLRVGNTDSYIWVLSKIFSRENHLVETLNAANERAD